MTIATCSDPALAYVLFYIKKFLTVIQIIGPIVAIIGLTMHLIKMMTSPDNKKNNGLIKNWIIAFLLLFFVPVIINVVMMLFNEKFDLPTCWNKAEQIFNANNS